MGTSVIMRWLLYVILAFTLAESNGEMMNLSINSSESLSSVFNMIQSCFMSTNYSTSCNTSEKNSCTNSSGHLICCKSLPVCYSSIDVFISGTHTLEENYTFTDLQNVRFTGSISGTPSTIKCNMDNYNFSTNSGIKFVQVKNLTIEYLNIIGCGMKHVSTSTSNNGEFITHLSALYIQNSTNILLSSVNISDSNATGLSIVDTNGTITIINSFFTANRVTVPAESSTVISGGGGIYIEYTECAPGVRNCNSSDYVFANNSIINIENCVFDQNRAWYNFSSSITATLDNRTFIGFGAGGGLSLQFNGQVKDVFIYAKIFSTNFSTNEANHGGGLSLHGRFNTSHIHLNVSQCLFLNNSAAHVGGGAIIIGFIIFGASEQVTHNTIVIDTCYFEYNKAPVVGGALSWHGGTEILGTEQTNYFLVSECIFLCNQAQYGSAIQINKEYFDLIVNGTFLNLMVNNCNFTYNSANILFTSSASDAGGESGVGVVSASKVNIQFSGYTEFSSNNSTALVGDEAELGFHNHSVTVFHDNHGFHGGAILLKRSSWMNMHFNSTLIFQKNVAVINGGAIYVELATLFDYRISYACFIKYFGQNIALDEWNTQLIFIDNKAADNQTNSIFTTTLRPCRNTYSRDFLKKQPFCFLSERNNSVTMYTGPLDNRQWCINNTKDQVSTASTKFCNVSNETVHVVPGKTHNFKACVIDEQGNRIINIQFIGTCASAYSTDACYNPSYVSSESLSNVSYVLPSYRINNGSIQLGGAPGSTCQLQLQTIEDFQIAAVWSVKLLNCPPGFFHSGKDGVCTCLTDHIHDNPAISHCEETLYQAYYDEYYWIGYKSDDATDLLTGPCPYQYCYQDHDVTGNELLPETANKTVLDRFVCGGSSRTGMLCGRCIDGYSVTLNSPTFTCNKCGDEYKLGVLYLLLSYILPVTILFVIIMMFDIRMTTGPIGSFIFFVQIVSSEYHYILIYSINVNNPTILKTFNAILGIYSISNLDFFNHDIFKYCIFQRAGTIDIVAFELLLSLYPVLLIMAYALFRKYYYVCKWSWCFRRFSISNKPITHGICAFLVICFGKINLQAFTILTPGEITFIDDTIDHPYKTLVYLQGNLEFFTEMPHTLYALGAILFIVIVIAIPTLILLFHPIMMRIAVFFHWGESRIVVLINKCLMIDRLKPVLDSFQGNYKDNLQFFAGLQIFFY